MGYPTIDEAEAYKGKVLTSQVRAAVELDYPVFSGAFADEFDDGALDTDLWFENCPSWGAVTEAGTTVLLSTTGQGITPPWLQSRHNLAFPIRRDTDWVFEARVRFPVVTGFGVFLRVCGRSFRDAEAIWGLKCNTAEGLKLDMPDGYAGATTIWSTAGSAADWRRYKLSYNHVTQVYTAEIDQNDDGVYENVRYVDVDGRYADAVVIGNSTAIQGQLGDWTQIEVDYIRVTGTAETVQDPTWAAPFTYDSTRFSWLPTLLGGRVSCHKDNTVDAAELSLDNFSLAEDGSWEPRTYTGMRFLNRRAIVQARVGDGSGKWLPWVTIFDGLCAEKQVSLDANGDCNISLPMRDRWRATADDMEILGCYSDAGAPIDGVDMGLTVAGIIENIYQAKCGMPAASHNVVATPHNTPRNYNVYRKSAQAAVADLAEQTALAVYQDPANAQIQVKDWAWGSDTPGYNLHTAEEILALTWNESAFNVTSAEQISFENTNIANGGFTHTWPPHREPYYGRQEHINAVTLNASASHDDRPIACLTWWIQNRKLGAIDITARGQLWVEHDLELSVSDSRFIGFSAADTWIVDGWEHAWGEDGVIITTINLINTHPDRFLRTNLMP